MKEPFQESKLANPDLLGGGQYNPSSASQSDCSTAPPGADPSSMEQQPHKQQRWAALFFLVSVPAIAHLLFSWMGMNPTDDGFFFGMGRRILDGQLPHLDFITARPAGTGLMWAPVIIFGGDYTIWISRLTVWFEFACIAWIWTAIVARLLRQSLGLFEQVALALVVFAITAHHALLTPWPADDGLWFTSIGLLCCLSPQSSYRFLGYLIIGASCLFKQNFLAIGPAFLVVLGQWRQVRYWLALVVIPTAYVTWICAGGGFHDFVLQMTSHADLYDTGFRRYLHSKPLFCGFIASYFGLLAVSGQIKTPVLNLPQNARSFLISLGTAAVFIPSAISLVWSFTAPQKYSFVLFGLVMGAAVYFLCRRDSASELIRAALLVLAVMWTVSISIGYNCPALGAGIAAVLLAGYLRMLLPSGDAGRRFRAIWRWCLLASTVVTLICFGIGRVLFIYRDLPAWKLTCSLNGVLPGGKLIKTNPVTYEYMKELHDLVQQYQGREYMILPDGAIWWIKAPQGNPLPTSWPLDFELGTPQLYNRFIQALDAQHGRGVIFLAKVMGFNLVNVPAPDWYSVVPYVKSHFHKIGETKYWEVYE